MLDGAGCDHHQGCGKGACHRRGPSTLDPVDWGFTPKQNARVQESIVASERDFRTAGYDVDMCLSALNADLGSVLVPYVQAKSWDVVVISGGIRKPPNLLLLFEQIVNVAHRYAPQAAIACNTTPTDMLEAVERQA